MMASEKSFELKIRTFLSFQGAWHIKYWGGGVCTVAGVPDILACIHGKFVGVEVKAKDGRPSMLQIKTLERIRQSSGAAVLLYPDEEDFFKEWVKSGCPPDSAWYRKNIDMQKKWEERLKHDD